MRVSLYMAALLESFGDQVSRMGLFFFFSSRRRHTRLQGDWSSDVCSSDLMLPLAMNELIQKNLKDVGIDVDLQPVERSEEHTSESSHLVISYAVFCLKKKKIIHTLVILMTNDHKVYVHSADDATARAHAHP